MGTSARRRDRLVEGGQSPYAQPNVADQQFTSYLASHLRGDNRTSMKLHRKRVKREKRPTLAKCHITTLHMLVAGRGS